MKFCYPFLNSSNVALNANLKLNFVYTADLQIRGIEPISSVWKTDNLPLIYICGLALTFLSRMFNNYERSRI
jgi:hypothetical protein